MKTRVFTGSTLATHISMEISDLLKWYQDHEGLTRNPERIVFSVDFSPRPVVALTFDTIKEWGGPASHFAYPGKRDVTERAPRKAYDAVGKFPYPANIEAAFQLILAHLKEAHGLPKDVGTIDIQLQCKSGVETDPLARGRNGQC